MAQDQKPKSKSDEWEEIENPDEWEEIPDPALTEEYGPPISAAPPEPQVITEPTDFWGGVKKSITSGDAMRTADQSAKGWMQGAVLDLPHGMWEGAKMLATTNPIGAAAYGLMGKELPVNEAAGALKDLPYNLGKATEMAGSQPYEYGRMLGNIFGQPAMGEAFFGNIPGLPSGLDIVKGGGKGIAVTGRVIQKYHPFSEAITRGLAGTAGSSAFGPYGTAGALFVKAPKFLTGPESAIGRGIERGGEWIRDIDGSVTRAEIDDFWGTKRRPGGGEPPDDGGGGGGGVMHGPRPRDPLMDAPFHPSDVRALKEFYGGPKNAPITPVETTVNQVTPDPLSRAPFNVSDAESAALKDYQNWKSGPEYVPPPVTINEATPSAFDKYGMMDKDVPEPGAPSTGSAFEQYMRGKGKGTGEEAPQVDVMGNELEPSMTFKAQEVPAGVGGDKLSVNPEGDILWPDTPSPEVVRQVESGGFKFEPASNIFRKLLKEDKGSFEPGVLWEHLKRMLGRDPSDAELGAAVRREVKPGEPTGRVAPFLSPDERVQRLDDLQNVPPPTPNMSIPGADPYTGAADPPLTPAERGWTTSANEGLPVSDIRQQNIQSGMHPLMEDRVNQGFGGAREFDFNQPPPEQGMFPMQTADRPIDADAGMRNTADMMDRLKAPTSVEPRQMSMEGQMKDAEILDYLKKEDAKPPEMTDVSAWEKLRDLGKKLLGDESGHFDPNELWWNLRRYFNRVPTEEELTRGMQVEGYKPGDRLKEISEAHEVAFDPKMWPKEPPTWKTTPMEDIKAKLKKDMEQGWEPPSRGLGDVADELYEQFGREFSTPKVERKLVNEIHKFIQDTTDIEIMKKYKDILETMADNAETHAQKLMFDVLSDIASKKYYKLKGQKPPEEAYNRPHNPAEHGQPWYWKYGSGRLSDWPPTSLDSIIRDIPDADLKARLKELDKPSQSNELMEEMDVIEWELRRRNNLPKNETLEQRGRREADEDRKPSDLPAGHVDIEGTRFIDLGQAVKPPNQSADVPLKFGYDLSDTLKNNPEAFKKGTNPAFEELKQKARKLGINPDDFPEPTMYENPLADAVKKAEKPKKRTPSEQTKFARKSDDLWRVLIGGDKPKYWVESNLKAEELINKTTDRDTLESYAEALDEWAKDHTKDTDHRMAGWMMDLRKLVMKKLEE